MDSQKFCASVIIGKRHDPLIACLSILVAVFMTILSMLVLKKGYDFVRPRRAPLLERYIDITGRITALYVGTVSIDMIMRGVQTWADKFR
jgi:multiple antibiotic resistance protein